MDTLFPDLPEQIQTELKDILFTREFSAGETVFQQGALSRAIYFVTSGRIKITRVTREGYETVLCMRGPSDIFCPVPVMDHGEQLGSAVALTDGAMLWAEKSDFNSLCQKYPELLAKVQGDCLFEVRRLVGRMEAFNFRSLRERLAFTLLDFLNHHPAENGSEHEVIVKQQELAGLVGASRESVSRTLSEFENLGILSTYRGRLVIHDQEKLKLISG